MKRLRPAAVLAVATKILVAISAPPANGKVCQKRDGKHIGVANQLPCPKETIEMFNRPGKGFLGLFPGTQINYDTAQAHGNLKTRKYWQEAGKNIKRSSPEELRKIERAYVDAIERERAAVEKESALKEQAYKKASLEENIKENFALSLTGVNQKVSSVSCKPTQNQNVWLCNIKLLGSDPQIYRIEVDGSTWA